MTDNLNLLLCSSSTVHPMGYLEYCKDDIAEFFSGCSNLIFISYARPGGVSLENYSLVAKKGFEIAGLKIRGIEEFENPNEAIANCDGIFTGGGNTFLLLKTLYEKGLIDPIKQRVKSGLKYMGASAGSNVAGPSIKTTNDMPIVYPPSFESFGFVPFNINPHYLDPDLHSTHKGETRETRINEYHFQNDNIVVGLREGSILKVENRDVTLIGTPPLRVFEKGKEAKEYDNSANINFLLD
jgi:dipeptidase E